MVKALTLNLLTTTIVAPPSNASKWQMGFNSAFKGLNWLMFYSVQRFFVSQMFEISVTTNKPAQLNNFRLLLQLPYLGSYYTTLH